MTQDTKSLDEARRVIGVSSEEVCARAKRSKSTFLNADRGVASQETIAVFREVLEGFRRERMKQLSNLVIKTAG